MEAAQARTQRERGYANLGRAYLLKGDLAHAEVFLRKALELDPDRPDSLLCLGRIYQTQARYDEAIRTYQRAAELDPTQVAPFRGLASTAFKAGDLESAVTHFQKAINVREESTDRVNLAACLVLLGRLEDALPHYRTATEKNPGCLAAQYGLGVVLLRLGKPAECLAPLKKACELEPDYLPGQLTLAFGHLLSREFESARIAMERVLTLDPFNPLVQFAWGLVAKNLGRGQDAICAFGRALELQPGYGPALSALGSIHFRRKEFERAAEIYARCERDNPTQPFAPFNLACCQLEMNQIDEAIQSFERALALGPGFVRALTGIGNALWRAERFQEALDSYKKGVATDSGYAACHYDLGVAWLSQGRLAEAQTSLTRALALWSDSGGADAGAGPGRDRCLDEMAPSDARRTAAWGLTMSQGSLACVVAEQGDLERAELLARQAAQWPDARAHSNLGAILSRQNKLDEAIRWLRSAIDLDPKLARAYHNLAWVLVRTGAEDEAIRFYEQAIALEPTFCAPRIQLARLLGLNGDFLSALEHYHAALGINPGDWSVQLEMGDLCQRVGSIDRAFHHYIQAAELSGSDPTALERMGHLYERLGQHKEAVSRYRQVAELDPGSSHVHFRLGICLEQLGQEDEALHSYRRAIEQGKEPEGLSRAVRLFLRLGFVEEAQHALDRGIQADGDDPELLALVGEIHLRKGEVDQAIVMLERSYQARATAGSAVLLSQAYVQGRLKDKAQEILRDARVRFPTEPGIHFQSAMIHLENAEGAEAVRAFGRLVSLAPAYPGGYSGLGDALGLLGRHEEAVTAYRKASVLDTAFTGYTGLGDALFAIGEIGEAISAYKRAVELDDRSHRAHYLLGRAFLEVHDDASALRFLTRATELKEGYGPACFKLGEIHRLLGKPQEAVRYFEKATVDDPQDVSAHVGLGLAFLDIGSVAQAMGPLKKAFSLDKKSPEVQFAMGEAFQRAGNPDKALVCYRNALMLKSDYVMARRRLGDLHLEQGRLADAAACYRALPPKDPSLQQALLTLGDALAKAGKVEEAQSTFDRAIQLAPKTPQTWVRLGRLLIGQGRQADAIVAFERAVQIDPDASEAFDSLGELYMQSGEVEKAIECFQRALGSEESEKPEVSEALEPLAAKFGETIDKTAEKTVQETEPAPSTFDLGSGEQEAKDKEAGALATAVTVIDATVVEDRVESKPEPEPSRDAGNVESPESAGPPELSATQEVEARQEPIDDRRPVAQPLDTEPKGIVESMSESDIVEQTAFELNVADKPRSVEVSFLEESRSFEEPFPEESEGSASVGPVTTSGPVDFWGGPAPADIRAPSVDHGFEGEVPLTEEGVWEEPSAVDRPVSISLDEASDPNPVEKTASGTSILSVRESDPNPAEETVEPLLTSPPSRGGLRATRKEMIHPDVIAAALARATASDEDDVKPPPRPGDRQMADAYVYVGRMMEGKMRVQEAALEYRRATEVDPTYEVGWRLLANASNLLKDWTTAVTALERLREISPNDLSLEIQLGSLHKRLGDFDGAFRSYQRALEIDPDRSDLAWEVGSYLFDHRRWSDAIPYLERARKSMEGKPVLYYQLALSYLATGRASEAAPHMENAFAFDSKNRVLALGTARLREQVGDWQGAGLLLEEYLREKPSDPEVTYELACVHARAGEETHAVELLERAVEIGFSDRLRLQREECLASLRRLPEFRSIEKKLDFK